MSEAIIIPFSEETEGYGRLLEGGKVGAWTWEVWEHGECYAGGEASDLNSAAYSAESAWSESRVDR